MVFDTPTLFLCVTIAGYAGSAILFAFQKVWKSRSRACSQSLFLWSAGLFVTGNGSVLIGLRGTIPDEFSIILANALIVLGTGLRRGGFAAFLGRPRFLGGYAAIALLWIALCFYPPFMNSFISRVNFMQVCLIGSCLWVIWMAFRQNPENLKSAKLLGVTNIIECAAYVWFVIHQNILLFPTFLSVFQQDFMTAYLVTILASIIMTMVLPACMVIERASHRFKEEALKDPLTGLSNRRAVLNEAEDWIGSLSERASEVSYTLVLFDLDDIAAIKKRFGPEMNDSVLQLFGRVLAEEFKPPAMIGRIEGETFIAILPDTNKEISFLTVQKTSRKFTNTFQDASNGKFGVSVCAGLVTATSDSPVERVMEAAYKGVSSAKRKGRAQIVAMDLAANGSLKQTLATGEFASLRRKAA